MKSAIYYPGLEDLSEATAKSALLLLDKLNVIVPPEGYVDAPPEPLADAWGIIGGHIVPDPVQQRRAHEHILALLATRLPDEYFYRDDLGAPGARQKAIMADHPMAYLYQLSRAR